MVRATLIGAIVLFASTTYAQSIDPSGHWVGAVNMPTLQIEVEVDLVRSASGQLFGTLSTPAQKLIGLPLSKIEVNGTSISFEARTDQGFDGMLSPDGSTMSGSYTFQSYAFPFMLMRQGQLRSRAWQFPDFTARRHRGITR